jgi:hypothetical protein
LGGCSSGRSEGWPSYPRGHHFVVLLQKSQKEQEKKLLASMLGIRRFSDELELAVEVKLDVQRD